MSNTLTQLGISWPTYPYTGWGVYGTNLALQLLRLGRFNPVFLQPSDGSGLVNPLHRMILGPAFERNAELTGRRAADPNLKLLVDFPILHALGNNLTPGVDNPPWGSCNLGVIFLEDTQLRPEYLAWAREHLHWIIAGSRWNERILRDRGLEHVTTILQGVDPVLFHPAERGGLLRSHFVIFSGGKLEYRKGQDLVVAAFKIFHRRHPDALLMTSWQNLWPEYLAGLDLQGHLHGLPAVRQGRLDLTPWLHENGLVPGSFLDLGLSPNYVMSQLYREVDLALFPNRCEGGTNLMAMEAMACGIPTILSANTGHLDLMGPDLQAHCYPLLDQRPVKPMGLYQGYEGWGESQVEEILEVMERAYAERGEARRRGRAAAAFMRDWSWEKQIQRLCQELQLRGV